MAWSMRRRRWLGGIALILSAVMLGCGESVLKGRLTGSGFLVYWVICFLLTGLAMGMALWDLRVQRRNARAAQRELRLRRVVETTVEMFEKNYPDQPTNKPVCTDCHGVHNIMKPDDPQAGIAFKNNLLVKCQQCHPDATTETFTDAWLSHYEPSPRAFPIVYYANLFYLLFIPLVLGGMLFFVLTDIYRRFKNRRSASSTEEVHK